MIAPDKAETFLARIAGDDFADAGRVAVIVAHPDDETLGCGALLSRLRKVDIIVATDGAPRDLHDAKNYGFADAASYARARRAELALALAIAGVESCAQLGFADQGCVAALPDLVEAITAGIRRVQPDVILTHAYEGGHPDHDAVAFAVSLAASSLAHSVGVIEMPYYRESEGGMVFQSFVPHASREVLRKLPVVERARKKKMVDAYVTQQAMLCQFALDAERFRILPAYDYHMPANNGEVFYESQPWGTTRQDWLAAVAAISP